MVGSNHIVRDNVLFFDGFCVLCSGTVRLLIKIDKKRILKYSSLQGNLAKVTLDSRHFGSNESVVFWEEGVFYERSEAVIRILVRLGGAYKIAGFALRIFPFFALNFLYSFIARNRFRIFGKNDSCLVPTTENRDRFIP